MADRADRKTWINRGVFIMLAFAFVVCVPERLFASEVVESVEAISVLHMFGVACLCCLACEPYGVLLHFR